MLSLHGLRRSEVLGLRFEDFSQEGWVTIARSRPPSSRKQITTEDTKSKASRRTIKIDEETLSAIMRDSARRGTQEGFVAVDEAGGPISSDRYTDLWRSLVAETGLPVHNFLVLRRSVETAMRDSGVPIHISAAVMGHSELMSMKHYTAAHQERIDTAHESMNALLDRSV